jgi:hypothetical protein
MMVKVILNVWAYGMAAIGFVGAICLIVGAFLGKAYI